MYRYINASKTSKFLNLDDEADMQFLEKTLKKLESNHPDFAFEISQDEILGYNVDSYVVHIPLYAVDGRNKSTLYKYLESEQLGYVY